MLIKENYALKKLTTMKVGGPAKFFVKIKNEIELQKSLSFAQQKKLSVLILAGGSNLIISDRGFKGLVISMGIRGFKILRQNRQTIIIRVGAGEIWDEIVKWAVKLNWWGIENLSAIPGTMGAMVVQNAGAYGVEAKDFVQRVEVYDTWQKRIKILSQQACEFDYRQSIFNSRFRGRYIILNVDIKLTKVKQPKLDYMSLKKYFQKKRILQPDLKQIRRAVIKIRQSKLPNWHKVGTAGSFFKNFLLTRTEFNQLFRIIKNDFGASKVAELKRFKTMSKGAKKIKVPTAWLMDNYNLKGLRYGYAQIYKRQPLVIININNKARASDVLKLFRQVRRTLYKKTGLKVEPEPIWVGFSQREVDKYFELP